MAFIVLHDVGVFTISFLSDLCRDHWTASQTLQVHFHVRIIASPVFDASGRCLSGVAIGDQTASLHSRQVDHLGFEYSKNHS